MNLIFDMDGVLVDNQKWHLEAWVEFGKRHDLIIRKEDFLKHFGSTNQSVLVSLFSNNLSEDEITSFGNEKEAIYREMYKPFIKPLKGLDHFLEYVSGKGFKIALATSAPYENVKFTLETTKLEKYFEVITDASLVKQGKPDPQVYLITAHKLGVKPFDCLVFEDSVPGIQSAQAAGMQVIGVATTHNSEELSTYVNDIIMNFEVTESIIDKLLHASHSK